MLTPEDDAFCGQLDGNNDTGIKMDENLSVMWMSDTSEGLLVDECGVKLSKEFNRKVIFLLAFLKLSARIFITRFHRLTGVLKTKMS